MSDIAVGALRRLSRRFGDAAVEQAILEARIEALESENESLQALLAERVGPVAEEVVGDPPAA